MTAFRHSPNRPLTGPQRSALGMLYKRAYARAVEHFATNDLPEKDWRHEQCKRACGVTISDAVNDQFEALKMHGEDLCGSSGKAFDLALRLPDVQAEHLRALVRESIERWSPWGMSHAYAAVIVKAKFKGKAPEKLTPWELQQLLYTLNNRGRSMKERAEGNLDGSRRNKKQRRAAHPTVEGSA